MKLKDVIFEEIITWIIEWISYIYIGKIEKKSKLMNFFRGFLLVRIVVMMFVIPPMVILRITDPDTFKRRMNFEMKE